MNNILRVGLLAILIVFILKFALKLAANVFGGFIALAVLIILVGIYKEVKNRN